MFSGGGSGASAGTIPPQGGRNETAEKGQSGGEGESPDHASPGWGLQTRVRGQERQIPAEYLPLLWSTDAMVAWHSWSQGSGQGGYEDAEGWGGGRAREPQLLLLEASEEASRQTNEQDQHTAGAWGSALSPHRALPQLAASYNLPRTG